jgi:AraC-like DNA-binding protein
MSMPSPAPDILRATLALVCGSIERLAGQENLPASVAEQISTLARDSANLLRLVNQLSAGECCTPAPATGKDKEFLQKLHDEVEDNVGNANFSVGAFAQALGVGRTVFYRKVKGLTDYSPNKYLRFVRLKKAAELLATTRLNVSEVSYKVGIEDPFYFSKCFKAQFGISPSQYQKDSR